MLILKQLRSFLIYRAERSAAQSLRQQQDQAYEESLRADQEKDRKREEERKAREEQEAREQEQLNAQELEVERIRREKELSIRKVPLEPEPSNPRACHLQIKLGERTMKRRFLMTDTIEVRFNITILTIAIELFLLSRCRTCIIGYLVNRIHQRILK